MEFPVQGWIHDGVPLRTRELVENSHTTILGGIDREFRAIEGISPGTTMGPVEPAPRVPVVGNTKMVEIVADSSESKVIVSQRIALYENRVPVDGNWRHVILGRFMQCQVNAVGLESMRVRASFKNPHADVPSDGVKNGISYDDEGIFVT